MATKKSAARSVTPEKRELDNFIEIGDKCYNINAVEANHVTNPLIITKHTSEESTDEVQFNGGTAGVSVGIVPASGGHFSGPITVADHDNDNPISSNSVLNSSEINAELAARFKVLSNTAMCYIWDPGASGDDKFKASNTTPANSETVVNSVSIIVGPDLPGALSNLCAYIKLRYPITAFFYVSSDSTSLYFCNRQNTEADFTTKRLADSAVSADQANQLTTSRKLAVDLSSTSTYTNFNGKNDATSIPVSGVLPITKGGTGCQTQAQFNNSILECIRDCTIVPSTIRMHDYADADGGAAQKVANTLCSIDANNGDIGNVNAMWFKNMCTTQDAGMFFPRENSSTDNKWDRVYAVDGKLYFEPNIVPAGSATEGGSEVYHTGNIAEVISPITSKLTQLIRIAIGTATVSSSGVLALSMPDTATAKIIMSQSAPTDMNSSYNTASNFPEGTIWIKYT